MKRILVTGAAGFIGRHCLPLLQNGDDEVHAVFCNTPPFLDGVKWHQTDLLEREQLRELMNSVRPTHLLHFAWIVTPGTYWTSPDNFRWVESSLEMLRLFAQNGGERVVGAGTCAEYDWNYGYCSEAVTPLAPQTVYGACKHALSLMQQFWAEQAGMSSAWGRVFFPYGPHEASPRLVPSVVRSLLHDQPALCSHGKQIRDFMYVEDVAAAFVALLHSDVKGAVNIASGQALALKDIAFHIADALNKRDLVRLGALPAAPNEPPLLVADVRRLRDEVGWQPHFELHEALGQTLDWWRAKARIAL